jgi:hypothetical protein
VSNWPKTILAVSIFGNGTDDGAADGRSCGSCADFGAEVMVEDWIHKFPVT